MQFILQTCLCLLLFCGVLGTLTHARTGTILTAAGISTVMLLKHLWLPALFSVVIFGISMLFDLVAPRYSPFSGVGPFVSRLAGSLMLLLVLGIFFGPSTSLIFWLLLSGLQLLPQFRSKARPLSFNTLMRSGLAAVWLGLGLYAVYGG